MTATRILIISLVLSCCAALLQGGVGEWTVTGPLGANVNAFALDAQNARIFAGTANGVFSSGDGGDSWARVSQGLVQTQVTALAIDPQNPLCLFAAVFGGGVYKSVDGGENWAPVNNGLTNLEVVALAIDPQDGQTLYAGTFGQGLFGSNDGGANWTRIEIGPSAFLILGVVVAPSNSQILYAADGVQLYRSENRGATWTVANAGGELFLDFRGPILVDRFDSNLVFASTDRGVARSDNGLQFRALARPGTLFEFPTNGLVRDPSDPDVLYAGTGPGFLKIGTEGEDPQILPVGDLYSNEVFALLALAGPTPRLLAGASLGMFRSDDGGNHWTEVKTGLQAPLLSEVALDAFNSQSLYAVSAIGFLQSADGGSTWRRTGRGLDGLIVRGLTPHPTDPRILYVGSSSIGVFRSDDGGATWRSINEGLTERTIWSLAIDPTNPSTIYAGTSGTSRSVGVFKSVNGGATWAAANPGNLTSPFQVRVAVSPSNPSILYAGTPRGLFRSIDGAENWQRLDNFPDTLVQSVTIHPSDSDLVFAATRVMGLFRSPDGGNSWTRLGADTLHPDVRRAVMDPNDPQKVYAATNGGGVFFSPDGGDSWAALNDGLDNLFVRDLRINLESDRLYAATLAGFAEYPRSSLPAAAVSASVSVGGNLAPAGSALYEIVVSSNGGSAQQGALTAELTQTLPPDMRIVALEADSGNVALGPSRSTLVWRGDVADVPTTIRLETRIGERASGVISTRGRLRIGEGGSQIVTLSDDPAAPGSDNATAFEIGASTIDPDALAVPFTTPINSTFVGVAVANTSDFPNRQTFQATGLRSDGQVAGEAEAVSLGSGQQRTFLTSEVVDQAATVVAANAQQGDLSSFFLLGDDPLRSLDGVGAALRDGQLLYVPDVQQSGSEDAYFYLFNSDDANVAQVTLTAFTRQGVAAAEGQALLEPRGSIFASFPDLFGIETFEGYVGLRADRPVRSFALQAGPETFRTLAAMIPTIGRRAFAPHFFLGFSGGTTELSILNLFGEDATVTVRAFGDGRGLIAEPILDLPARTLTKADLGDLLGIAPGEPVQGSLELEFDAGGEELLRHDAGFAAVVTYDGGTLNTRSSLPLIDQPRLGINFLQVANAADQGIFQGLAIQNSGPLPAIVSVFAFNADGNRSASRVVFVNSGARVVGLLDEETFFGEGFQQSGGFLQVLSLVPVTAYSLFGGAGFLSAVEGQ